MSATPFENSMGTDIREKVVEYPPENVQKSFEIPRMPPWFVYVGSPKLYQALAGILRLVGLSLLAGLFHFFGIQVLLFRCVFSALYLPWVSFILCC